jgi:hypothetical protein
MTVFALPKNGTSQVDLAVGLVPSLRKLVPFS